MCVQHRVGVALTVYAMPHAPTKINVLLRGPYQMRHTTVHLYGRPAAGPCFPADQPFACTSDGSCTGLFFGIGGTARHIFMCGYRYPDLLSSFLVCPIHQHWVGRRVCTVLFTWRKRASETQGGATTTGPDATPPQAICENLGGGVQLGGGRLEGVVGGGVGWRVWWGGGRLEGVGGGVRPWGGGFPRWGGLRATHYYHMHTSQGDVCLGWVWGSCWWLL